MDDFCVQDGVLEVAGAISMTSNDFLRHPEGEIKLLTRGLPLLILDRDVPFGFPHQN